MGLGKEVGVFTKDVFAGTGRAVRKHPVLMGILALAGLLFVVLTVYRMMYGLGVTNIGDYTAWGLWTAFKLSAVVVAGCGFVMAGLYYVFGIKSMKPFVRSAVVMGMLGYTLFALTLVIELGFPWRIVHPIWMWQHHSVLFEVAWCVILYLTVLYFEFFPNVFERFKMNTALKIIRPFTIMLVIFGIMLSILHQSSLGSLFLAARYKMNPLWWTPWLPVFFFTSCVFAGMALVIFSSLLVWRFKGEKPPMKPLGLLALGSIGVLALYLGFKFMDLITRPEARAAFARFDGETFAYLAEMLIGIVIPIFLYANRKVRESFGGLLVTSLLVILFGGALNRLNVSVVAVIHGHVGYFPNLVEFGMVFALGTLFVTAYIFIITYFPVFGPVKTGGAVEEKKEEPAKTE